MNIHCLTGPPDPDLARALAAFEKEFIYPLGPHDSFSISHGADYSLFFRSMGDARIYLAESDGKILGAQAVVRREVGLADGSTIPAAYLCDTKVIASRRGGIVLGKLLIAACKETITDGYNSAFSIVMEGSVTSDKHTGRLDIPAFSELGKLAILRFDTSAEFHGFRETSLPSAVHRPSGGNMALSSKMTPLPLSTDGASATLTDTRRGKRLHKSDGTEMLSAHLAKLHFTSIESLTALIRIALRESARLGLPGLFVALPEEIVGLQFQDNPAITTARARIFGTAFPSGTWMVNTSEI